MAAPHRKPTPLPHWGDPRLPGHREFWDVSHAWRRLFAEAWGTFLLVLVAAGADMAAAQSAGAVTPAMASVAAGLTVAAIIYFMGAVSGAHINPAVSLAFALRGNFPWRRVPGYIAAQSIGGVAAVFALRSMLGDIGMLGATLPSHGVGAMAAFWLETMLTAGLVNVVLGTASGARNIGTNGALAVGGYVAAAGLWAKPLCGASMNPVRSLAPDLVRGDFSTSLVYVAGPLLGALIAVGFEWILKGPPTAAGTQAAQGEPDGGR